MDRDQRIRDPVHNLIPFSTKNPEDRLLWDLLQTAPLQRLRRIRQLGFSEFVYPGATHTRFSHSLGAMQMARRMLGAFERNQLFELNDQHALMRKATLAASLLHDVGHGPYSHVFEELSEEYKIEKDHEEYTKDIIKSKEINKILEEYGVNRETLSFFEVEAGYTPYDSIISSQMDCDRLDFLARDRYYTGIKSQVVDFEWLFDSLIIDEVTIDPVDDLKRYAFVVLPKGISVVEEFVIAYVKMYHNVYFHKTTRAVQFQVMSAVRQALKEYGPKLIERGVNLARFFLDEKARTLEIYSSLDDSSITSFIHHLAEGEYGSSSILAQRLLRRDLFKCLEIPPLEGGGNRNEMIGRLIKAMKAEGLVFYPDVVSDRSYKQYDAADEHFLENIIVRKDGENRGLHHASSLVKSISVTTTRFYFEDAASLARSKEILKAV
ncbi:MAG: HD domain-containing protein [Bauldia sp.]